MLFYQNVQGIILKYEINVKIKIKSNTYVS